MEPKKISFGFRKVTQKPSLVPQNNANSSKIELIDCLEGQTIKIKDAVEEIKRPLVIPIRDSSMNLLERVKETKKIKTEAINDRPDNELSLDELAAKQLIEEAQAGNKVKQDAKIFKLPAIPDKPVIEDKEEPNLTDYESIPIEDYGLAMLRGMGWIEGSGIGKNQKVTKPVEPELRPKGMGLGATKLVNAEKKPPPVDKDGKELLLVKGAHAKIIAGLHRGNYCEVLGLDDESSRIIVKTSIKNLILSLNEFLVQVVTKEEYIKFAKVINNAKYEEYKEKSKNKSEVFSSSEESPEYYRKQSKLNSKSDKRSSKNSSNKNSEHSERHRDRRQELDVEKARHKIKSEDKVTYKADMYRSRHHSRSHSYDYKSRSSKHRDSSYSSETDYSDSSIELRKRRDSDSSDCNVGRDKNSERERKHEDRGRKKKKSKKQKHTSSSEHKKSKNKTKKKHQGTSSDSDQSDQEFRRHRHTNHKDSHKNSRR